MKDKVEAQKERSKDPWERLSNGRSFEGHSKNWGLCPSDKRESWEGHTKRNDRIGYAFYENLFGCWLENGLGVWGWRQVWRLKDQLETSDVVKVSDGGDFTSAVKRWRSNRIWEVVRDSTNKTS